MHSNEILCLGADVTGNQSNYPLLYTLKQNTVGYASYNKRNLFSTAICRLAVSPVALIKLKIRHSKWPQILEYCSNSHVYLQSPEAIPPWIRTYISLHENN
jgi:hypothetical protein